MASHRKVAAPGSAFSKALRDRNSDFRHRRWIFVPYDQLSDQIGPLSREDPRELGIIVIENRWKAMRRPYHKQKLAMVLASLRHFVLEQARRGVAIQHLVADSPYRDALLPFAKKFGPIRVMRPAERELRADLAQLCATGALQEISHEGWLSTAAQFLASHPKQKASPPWRMDTFYRYIRRETGILMDGEKPLGGKFSFDPENRLPWRGKPAAPQPITFRPDEITREVCELIEAKYASHPGALDPENLPCTKEDAAALWSWAKKHCLPMFGPFEDAMSTKSRTLFHSRISTLLNLHRLLPAEVVRDAANLSIPLPSKEGFIRQILGWREFLRHVHEFTDGFRRMPKQKMKIAPRASDAGYGRWSGKRWVGSTNGDTKDLDGGAVPNFLSAHQPLPPAFWGKPSGLACLDTVVREVWEDAYGHHITRLMVLSNIATLLDISPRELTDWFWVAYADAYDWVVEPNVLGMGTFSLGDTFTTKPYVSGAAYIHRMSDYCGGCAFDPKTNCPLTSLYWAFLDRHQDVLRHNPRLAMPMRSLARRPTKTRRLDQARFVMISKELSSGCTLSVADPPSKPSGPA